MKGNRGAMGMVVAVEAVAVAVVVAEKPKLLLLLMWPLTRLHVSLTCASQFAPPPPLHPSSPLPFPHPPPPFPPLLATLVKQLDFYFSNANWAKDKFMQGAADADGYVSMSVLSSFQVTSTPPNAIT
jgi:hypothetical protein